MGLKEELESKLSNDLLFGFIKRYNKNITEVISYHLQENEKERNHKYNNENEQDIICNFKYIKSGILRENKYLIKGLEYHLYLVSIDRKSYLNDILNEIDGIENIKNIELVINEISKIPFEDLWIINNITSQDKITINLFKYHKFEITIEVDNKIDYIDYSFSVYKMLSNKIVINKKTINISNISDLLDISLNDIKSTNVPLTIEYYGHIIDTQDILSIVKEKRCCGKNDTKRIYLLMVENIDNPTDSNSHFAFSIGYSRHGKRNGNCLYSIHKEHVVELINKKLEINKNLL